MQLVLSGGAKLGQLLAKAGVLLGRAGQADWRAAEKDLRYLFGSHAVVMEGELPRKYWPLFHRASKEPALA